MAIAPGPGPTKSKIQNPNSKRPVWILDFGFWISDFGFWILDFGFWILDFGFRILDFGFWILDLFSLRSFCGGPKRPRLDFGFWILDFGFWILDFGFRILDFGFWISDFGFWILDYFPSFGFCIRYFLITPTRVGGFVLANPSGENGRAVITQGFNVCSRMLMSVIFMDTRTAIPAHLVLLVAETGVHAIQHTLSERVLFAWMQTLVSSSIIAFSCVLEFWVTSHISVLLESSGHRVNGIQFPHVFG